jgi:three-Cys-motif partner protein
MPPQMAHPTTTLWTRPDHTEAKHRILRRYLQAWFPILLRSQFPGATYFEGFAGPGEYERGEPGSPMIALNVLGERPDLLYQAGKTIRFAFLEEQPKRHAHLQDLLAPHRERFPAHVLIEARLGTFEELMESTLDDIGSWGDPIFANLDTWGADVPFWTVQRLGQNRSSEVLVTLVSDFFARFASEEHLELGDAQFGSRDWRRVVELEGFADKRAFLLAEYRATLARAGFPLSVAFELLSEGGNEIALLFGTTKELAIERMKDAMWQVDPVYGVRFRDPRDPGQESFFLQTADLVPLERMLLQELEGRRWHSVENLRRFALLQTIYREPHAMTVLRRLRDAGAIEQRPAGRLQRTSSVRLA